QRYTSLGMDIKSKQFKRQYAAGNLDLKNVSDEYINKICDYYKQFTNKKINLMNHVVLKNITKIEDVRFIPREIFRRDLLTYFNDRGMINTYAEKNLYNILFQEFNQPVTVIKKVRGKYYKNSIDPIEKKDVI